MKPTDCVPKLYGQRPMRKLSLDYGRSFADGEIICFSKDEGGTLKIVFKTWDEKKLEMFFPDTIRFLDNNMYDISDLVQIEETFLERRSTDDVRNNP